MKLACKDCYLDWTLESTTIVSAFWFVLYFCAISKYRNISNDPEFSGDKTFRKNEFWMSATVDRGREWPRIGLEVLR